MGNLPGGQSWQVSRRGWGWGFRTADLTELSTVLKIWRVVCAPEALAHLKGLTLSSCCQAPQAFALLRQEAVLRGLPWHEGSLAYAWHVIGTQYLYSGKVNNWHRVEHLFYRAGGDCP